MTDCPVPFGSYRHLHQPVKGGLPLVKHLEIFKFHLCRNICTLEASGDDVAELVHHWSRDAFPSFLPDISSSVTKDQTRKPSSCQVG